jgi:nucleoside-diphosphate-sugar epimerase
VIQSLKKIFGGVEVEHRPPRPEDFQGANVSIAKARRILGWEPKTKFKDGLRLYVDDLMKEAKRNS